VDNAGAKAVIGKSGSVDQRAIATWRRPWDGRWSIVWGAALLLVALVPLLPSGDLHPVPLPIALAIAGWWLVCLWADVRWRLELFPDRRRIRNLIRTVDIPLEEIRSLEVRTPFSDRVAWSCFLQIGCVGGHEVESYALESTLAPWRRPEESAVELITRQVCALGGVAMECTQWPDRGKRWFVWGTCADLGVVGVGS